MIDHIEEKPEAETQEPGIIPTPSPAPLPDEKKPRNQHAKTESPKIKQFSGRATEAEFNTINQALAARKKQLGLTENATYDIVRLALDLIKKNNSDFLSSLNTK